MTLPENDPLQVTNHLLETLLDSIPLIHNFKGKWSLIAVKLADLKSQLADLSDFPLFPSHPLSLDLLHSLIHTLSSAISLSSACYNPSLPQGKLRTQNDVDSISAQLDNHASDADVLIKSGILQQNAAVSGSKRESVRAEARNLITRLQIGTAESKNSAVDSLLTLLQEDDKNVLIAVAQGVVPVLVGLLDSSSSPEIKEKTVTAIARVSTVDSSKHVLVAEGLLLLNNLLRVLESGSGFAKQNSCIALQALSLSRDNARAIGSRGGISSLLAICLAGTPSSQAAAAAVLRNLASFSQIRDHFVEENAVSVLLSLAASGTTSAQENAIGCLSSLVTEFEDLKLLIAREGGIQSLTNFWDSAPNDRSLEVAVDLSRKLSSIPQIGEVLVSEGFINRIVSVLSCGVLGVRISAAKTVYELGFTAKTRKELGECGAIPPLVRMMEGKAVEERESAAKALSALMVCGSNRRVFRKEERGIISAVQLLDPMTKNLDKKYSVSVLASLIHSKKCRKQMIAAGACVCVQKLVEMEVEGAKKLSESLRRGKIWGVFA